MVGDLVPAKDEKARSCPAPGSLSHPTRSGAHGWLSRCGHRRRELSDAKALDAARAELERRHAVPVGADTGTHEDPAGPGVSAETSPPADRAGTRVSAETSTQTDRAATRGERDADALVLLADTLLAHGAAQRSGAERYQVVVHVDADTLTGHDAGGRCHTDKGEPLAAETGRRLACDASVVALVHRRGGALAVGRRTRTIGPALRRALAARDRGCRFPGCDRHAHLHAHHIQHWAHGGPTELANLVQVCHRHHRLLHDGGYTLARRAHGLEFRRPDGRVIPAGPRGWCGGACVLACPPGLWAAVARV